MSPTPNLSLGEILDVFTESWERGDCPRAERFLEQLPFEDSAELIYHEYCLAEASDLAPDPDEYLRRFPDHAEALSRLFQLHQAISVDDLARMAEPANLPQVGDDVGPYRLIRELGQGAFARVFLAEQTDLEDRLVVLKVSTKATAEPRLLARASHNHIVPVIRHASTDDGSLHLVCMPYLGGATLGDLLTARRNRGGRPRSGADLLADLDRVAAPNPATTQGAQPIRDLLADLSYPRALAWIIARLAEALDHARRRGVSHGDLKPSNILLTADGVPMLFDFNLAVDWRETDTTGADAGGTLAYMAPERLQALAGTREDGPTPIPDRHRADLYGLGLVLLEALTGRVPELPRERVRGQAAMAASLLTLRLALKRPPRGRWRRPIPPALGAILARCLAPNPSDRYALGCELAQDLDRWRTDLPLVHAVAPSRSVPVRQIHRHGTMLTSGIAVLAISLGLGSFASRAIMGSLRDQAFDNLAFLDRADADIFPFSNLGDWGSANLETTANTARRQLIHYDVLSRGDWTLHADLRNLPDREQGEQQAWIAEQVWHYTQAIKDRPDSPDDWRSAADLLDRTMKRFPLKPLGAIRLALADKLGVPAPSLAADAPVWIELYLAGVVAERDHAREALGYYRAALAARPDFFWADYRAATVACRINEYPSALYHLQRCVARRPRNAALHTHLAEVQLRLGQTGISRMFAWEIENRATLLDDALAECNRALAIDPEFYEALAARAMIRKLFGKVEEVMTDLNRFKTLTRFLGESRDLMLRFRSEQFYGPSYRTIEPGEKELLNGALAVASQDVDIRAALATTLFLDGRLEDTITECDRILAKDPRHLRARYLQTLTRYKRDHRDSVDAFAALIEDPRFEELYREDPYAIRAFHYVVNDHIKAKRFAQALQVAEVALVHINRMSLIDKVNSLVGETHYLVARAHASAPDAVNRLPKICDHLGRAFDEHDEFRTVWFATDSLFNKIRPGILFRLH